MSFLDAFKGYHQITLTPEDQEKTSFISIKRNYHYTMMPFGLKNTGTTYQRMVTRRFKDQIGDMVKFYIDDMVVKSKKSEEHVPNMVKVFERLRQNKLHLNAGKCALVWGLVSYWVT